MQAGVQLAVALGGVLALAVGRERADRVLLGRRQRVGIPVERSAGRGVDDAPGAGLQRRLQDRDRAEHVDRRVARRLLDRVAHVDLRRQVEDELRLELGEDPQDRLRVGDIGLMQLRPGGQCGLEVRALAGAQVVDHRNPIAPGDQGVDQVRADESSASGDDAVHAGRRL